MRKKRNEEQFLRHFKYAFKIYNFYKKYKKDAKLIVKGRFSFIVHRIYLLTFLIMYPRVVVVVQDQLVLYKVKVLIIASNFVIRTRIKEKFYVLRIMVSIE